jgi:hypothetical protein
LMGGNSKNFKFLFDNRKIGYTLKFITFTNRMRIHVAEPNFFKPTGGYPHVIKKDAC